MHVGDILNRESDGFLLVDGVAVRRVCASCAHFAARNYSTGACTKYRRVVDVHYRCPAWQSFTCPACDGHGCAACKGSGLRGGQ